jgi:imidazolonepropionase-like amidohydrolase
MSQEISFGTITMKIQRTRARSAFVALCCFAFLSSTAAAGDKLAIKVGKVITMAGEAIEDGVIVMEGGKITAVGPAVDVKIPWDAEVLDKPDLTAFPGFVEAHSSRGMDRANESIDVAPFLNIRDSIDPVNFYFEDALRWGLLTINVQQGFACVIGGQGMVVQPYGMTVEEMLVRPDAGIKMSARPKGGKSQATQAQALRKAFRDLRQHLEQLVQEKSDGDDRARREALYQGRDLEGERGEGRAMGGSSWKVDGLESIPRGEIDEKLEPLLDVVEGRVPVWFHCGAAMDVRLALTTARENGFLEQTTLVLESGCFKAVDEIAASGVSVVLYGNLLHVERDPVTGKEQETFVPKIYADKGVTFALSSLNQSTQSLWFQAATCVANGMEREAALAAVTTVPAKLLALDTMVGSLEQGKLGNVLLYSGDPLSMTSFVEYTVLRGELVYDRSTDVRAQHLIDGVVPDNTAALGGDEDPGHDPHGDEEPGGDGDDDGDEDGDEDGDDGDEEDGGKDE